MMIFLATFLASLLDPIAAVLCLSAGAFIRRYVMSAVVGAVILVALLTVLATLPKVAPIVAGRIAAGAFMASIGCLLSKKLWPKREVT
ncbi:hypothetical protein ALO95_200376 [Pseudomonas syringae pv. antirrhini]|nr:hypothetical protein ALO95_200376 [Pseudomonas syringae pv. antirrhini]